MVLVWGLAATKLTPEHGEEYVLDGVGVMFMIPHLFTSFEHLKADHGDKFLAYLFKDQASFLDPGNLWIQLEIVRSGLEST